MDKLEYELVCVKRELMRQRHKFYALDWLLHSMNPELTNKWREHYGMIDKGSKELQEIDARIMEIEKKLGLI